MCGDTLSSHPGKRFAYNILVALFAYIAPLVTIFYSYFRILYVLHKRSDRKTFRFVKCSTQIQLNHISTSKTKNSSGERDSVIGHSAVSGEMNLHNMKTITRAKFKTLKLTVLIGKNEKKNISQNIFFSNYLNVILVICFILCWTPYYCIVFFLLIADARFDPDPQLVGDPSHSSSSTYDERCLLIVMMLAVSNSVLDPLIYGLLKNNVCL